MGWDTGDECEVQSDDQHFVKDKTGSTCKRAGTHIAYRAPYFYLANNPAFPNLKMHIFEKWFPELDKKNSSKTLTQSVVDSGKYPVVIIAVLKAWMVWRTERESFLARDLGQLGVKAN